jgi:hypothetical protein
MTPGPRRLPPDLWVALACIGAIVAIVCTGLIVMAR